MGMPRFDLLATDGLRTLCDLLSVRGNRGRQSGSTSADRRLERRRVGLFREANKRTSPHQLAARRLTDGTFDVDE